MSNIIHLLSNRSWMLVKNIVHLLFNQFCSVVRTDRFANFSDFCNARSDLHCSMMCIKPTYYANVLFWASVIESIIRQYFHNLKKKLYRFKTTANNYSLSIDLVVWEFSALCTSPSLFSFDVLKKNHKITYCSNKKLI